MPIFEEPINQPMKTRHAAVAGKFYPGTDREITSQLTAVLEKEKGRIDLSLARVQILGGVIPHAGYMFSAYEAVHFFEILRVSGKEYDTVVIVNPNHTGAGADIALDDSDQWETPMGLVGVDKEFNGALPFDLSPEAHRHEHSGEVMLPMLQFFLAFPFKIVPVTLSRQNVENAQSLAYAIHEAGIRLHRRILLIASSDFSHYVHPAVGKQLDEHVTRQILKLDSKGVHREIREKKISACGYGPIMTLIEYALLAAEKPRATILRVGHSGEVIPSREVVDYISILFYAG
jgi:AmmeMemoRadiSam system protein B